MPIVLASASPRRAELLQQIGLNFDVSPSDIDESVYRNEPVTDYVQRMALSKAAVSREQHSSEDIIIAADTTVSIGDAILGKPESEAHCLEMLARLSGQTHMVHTAVIVSQLDYVGKALSSSEVSFRAINTTEAKNYWSTGEPKDKAGSYAIQGKGAVFVNKITGSYSGVVGLPLYELTQLLRDTDVSIL
ncbi:MAG: nucleoside triphosphate pyrophosphatase [Gammaproteobacteria bacterium]